MQENAKTSCNPRREVGLFWHWLGRCYFWLTGWRLEGSLPDTPKLVAVVAYHTSEWDFYIMLMVSFILRVKTNFMIKKEAFDHPLGGLLGYFGGIPVNRGRAQDTVRDAVKAFEQRPKIILGITPEGTRARTEYWKSGFYRIAKGANAPILMCALDFKRKVVRLGENLLYPSDDLEADLNILRAFYADVTARHPEQVGPIQFREEKL